MLTCVCPLKCSANGGGGAALLADAEFERLQAARAEERVERAHHAAGGVLNEIEPIEQLRIMHHQSSAEHIAVAPDVFRARVHRHVGAELQRTREHRAWQTCYQRRAKCLCGGRSRRTPAMSVIDISGLPGLSIQSSFVSGVMADSTAARSVASASETVMPARSQI